MSLHRDYILRMVEMVRLALARILRRKEEGDFAGARQELEAAYDQLLGPLEEVAPLVDSVTAAQLMGDPRRVLAWARLLAEDADLRRRLGEEMRADIIEHRALELALEACRDEPALREEAADLVAALRAGVADESLGARYRETLGLPPIGLASHQRDTEPA
jgi:hypothetical protein